MISTHDHYNRPGGDSLPIQRRGAENGIPDVRAMGTVGTTIPFGSVVMAGRDEGFDDFDAGVIAGPFSSMLNCELPSLPALYAMSGLFGVVTEDDGIIVGERGRVDAGRSTMEVLVFVPAAGLAVGTGLMVDFATPGQLIQSDAAPGVAPSAKVVGKVAQKVLGSGADETRLIFVRFDGTNGWM